MSRCFVSADWMNVEGRLTAHFSGDQVLAGLFAQELAGGHKVHSINAGIIYEIDPADAKKHQVNLKGQQRDAYDAGKRLTHMWNYGATPYKQAETFWITRSFAEKIDKRLRDQYQGVVQWRQDVVGEVFGIGEFQCPRCGESRSGAGGACRRCHSPRRPAQMKRVGWVQYPTRRLRTPFGRHRLFPGRRKDSANAVVAQLPQSSGISMWYRTLLRLHGVNPYGGSWPVPAGLLQVSPVLYAADELLDTSRDHVTTGTYDSFVLECEIRHADTVLEWLMWTMEQPWTELEGKRFPAEGSRGMNWRKAGPSNLDGLREGVGPRPLTASYARAA